MPIKDVEAQQPPWEPLHEERELLPLRTTKPFRSGVGTVATAFGTMLSTETLCLVDIEPLQVAWYCPWLHYPLACVGVSFIPPPC